jgi:hypothetical protein
MRKKTSTRSQRLCKHKALSSNPQSHQKKKDNFHSTPRLYGTAYPSWLRRWTDALVLDTVGNCNATQHLCIQT